MIAVNGARQVVSLLQNIKLPSNKRTLHNYFWGMSAAMVPPKQRLLYRKAEIIVYEHINME